MRRLRRFALAAVVLDALLGVGILLASGRAAEATGMSTAVVRYVPTEAGCAQLLAVAEGVWRYQGLAAEASCEEGR
jgi:hypothetical protein